MSEKIANVSKFFDESLDNQIYTGLTQSQQRPDRQEDKAEESTSIITQKHRTTFGAVLAHAAGVGKFLRQRKVIKTYKLQPATVQQIRKLLQPLDAQLQLDVSNYARGRQRYWLQHRWDLKERRFDSGVEAPELWQLCQQLCQTIGFEPEIGLIAKGEAGITLHRDDSYADFRAVSIQLGAADWSYDCQYPEYAWVPNEQLNPSNPTTYQINDCLVTFNCKNPHAAAPYSSARYSINLWRISKKLRPQFEQYTQAAK